MLKGTLRHELSCSSCGAPLHDLKKLPKSTRTPRPTPERHAPTRRPVKAKKKKKQRSLFSRVLEEALDVIEDVFD